MPLAVLALLTEVHHGLRRLEGDCAFLRMPSSRAFFGTKTFTALGSCSQRGSEERRSIRARYTGATSQSTTLAGFRLRGAPRDRIVANHDVKRRNLGCDRKTFGTARVAIGARCSFEDTLLVRLRLSGVCSARPIANRRICYRVTSKRPDNRR
jgi:hypothetical protein